MLLKDFVISSRRRLSALYPAEEAAAMTAVLGSEFFGVQKHTHTVHPELELASDALPSALSALDRLCTGEPLQYVLGYAEFFSRRFKVGPGVLIPRPETEELCAMAIKAVKSVAGCGQRPLHILDLCTGSGCIAWTMALEVPGSRVVAVDISDAALRIASSQKFTLDGSEISFVKADVLNTSALAEALSCYAPFDIIISNPPYIMEKEKAAMRANVLEHEPALALFVSDGDPLLFYRKIAEFGAWNSDTDSTVMVEINEALGDAVCRIFRESDYENVVLHKDIFSRNRFVSCSKKGHTTI